MCIHIPYLRVYIRQQSVPRLRELKQYRVYPALGASKLPRLSGGVRAMRPEDGAECAELEPTHVQLAVGVGMATLQNKFKLFNNIVERFSPMASKRCRGNPTEYTQLLNDIV